MQLNFISKQFPVNELEQPISLPISTPAPIPDYKFEGDVSPNVTIGDDTELASIWAM
jgi:hypothetical protein